MAKKTSTQGKSGRSLHLPFDVLWRITQAASEGPKPDFKVLCALGGTSRALRREAQKHIYQELLTYCTPDYSCHGDDLFFPQPYPDEFGLKWEDLQGIVETCPWITEYVRGVRFRWDYEMSDIDDDAVALIASFTKLQRLTIGRHETYFPLDWETLHYDTVDAWKIFMTLPSVHTLRLSSIMNIPPSILTWCKRLKRLSLDSGSSFSASDDVECTRSINLLQLRSTAGEESIAPLFVLRGPSNIPIIDVSALVHLDISLSKWGTTDAGILESLSNLSELHIDTWSQNPPGFDLPVVLQKIHQDAHRELCRLRLRFRLDRTIRDSTSLRDIISCAFPEGLPALETLEMDIVLRFPKYRDWQREFLSDVANLDELLFGSLALFPSLTVLNLAMTILDDADDGDDRYFSEEDIVRGMCRAVAKGGFRLDISISFAPFETKVRRANAPSSDEDGYESY